MCKLSMHVKSRPNLGRMPRIAPTLWSRKTPCTGEREQRCLSNNWGHTYKMLAGKRRFCALHAVSNENWFDERAFENWKKETHSRWERLHPCNTSWYWKWFQISSHGSSQRACRFPRSPLQNNQAPMKRYPRADQVLDFLCWNFHTECPVGRVGNLSRLQQLEGRVSVRQTCAGAWIPKNESKFGHMITVLHHHHTSCHSSIL